MEQMIMSTAAARPAIPLAPLRGGTRWRGLARRFALVSLVAAVAGCKGDAASGEREIVRPVKIATVSAAAQGRTLTYSGVVRPRIESNVGFRVGGKIVERAVNVGDRVKVGQVIARLDDADLKLVENSARAAVASARTRRDVTRDNLERAKPLLEKYADVGWAPIQIYFRLSPQELAMLHAGQELIFSEDPKPGERLLPADLKRGVLECNRHYRILRQADRLDVTGDANDPRAVPLADVPEVKAKLAIRIPESEPGQFQLTGHAGAFIERGPMRRHGWSTFEGRSPYAVGRAPSFSPTVTERTKASEPRDAALKTPVTLRPQPSGLAPQPPATGEDSAVPESKVTTADVLEALHRATGLPIVADFYSRIYPDAPRVVVNPSVPDRLRSFHALTRSRRSTRDFSGLP